MALTAQSALEWLAKREDALRTDRRRMLQSHQQELARVDAQIAAVSGVVQILMDPAKAADAKALWAALEQAGLHVEPKVG